MVLFYACTALFLREQLVGIADGTYARSPQLKQRIIQVCENKIRAKGPEVGLSFYAFFKNNNDNPKELMSAATWWIKTHQLDHFEKAVKIRKMVNAESSAKD